MRSKQLFNSIRVKLSKIENAAEAESITYLILDDLFTVSRTDLLIDKFITDYAAHESTLNTYLQRLLKKEPVQHVIGHVEFYGRKFLVNKNVLIPRQETEELVDLILQSNKHLEDSKIVDIGTGSGIIPITLKKEMPNNQVIGIDVSTAALATAKRNALLNNADVNFIESDILSSESAYLQDARLIISNPPYVTHAERASMDDKVLNFDPAMALFVQDEKPLIFYEIIAKKAAEYLVESGVLYFEINERFGNEVLQLLTRLNFKNVKLIKDMQGKDRFTTAEK